MTEKETQTAEVPIEEVPASVEVVVEQEVRRRRGRVEPTKGKRSNTRPGAQQKHTKIKNIRICSRNN